MTSEHRTIRIGCGSGFWGDSAEGPAELVRLGDIDFLVLDYLAEITMSILARMQQKRPDLGYATDFVEAVMGPLAAEIAAKNIKVVANAGGVNPEGCRDALVRVFEKLGVSLRVAVVTGDDVRGEIDALRARGDRDLESGKALPEHPLSANAYLGAWPIAEALRAGADVVVTGRCVDSALALGPLLATFDWSPSDWDKLALGSLAGHVIECGAQATGGVFTDWRLVEKDYGKVGFPIAECAEDGSFVLTKPDGTGGLVSTATVAEQIVYEVHDPAKYVLADVVCDLTNVTLEQVGQHRVRVTGARGQPPTDRFKVSLTYEDGFRGSAAIMIIGHEAKEKATRVGEAVLDRVERLLAARGVAPLRERSVEVLGTEAYFGANSRANGAREVILKIAAAHESERALELFAREIAPAATSMVQSITGFAGGRPRVQPIVRLASVLIEKSKVSERVILDGVDIPFARPTIATQDPGASLAANAPTLAVTGGRLVPLREIAHGRSGDKGNTANIGVLARRAEDAAILRSELTEAVVADYLVHLVAGRVRRYEWPGLHGFNFVLEDALGGGGIASLRNDPQGKALAQILLELPIRVPDDWVAPTAT